MRIKKYIDFIKESNSSSWYYDIDSKLDLIRSYIHIIDNSKIKDPIMRSYFIILHNFLIVERMFYSDVVKADKEINKFLNLERLNSIEEVKSLFNELYDVNSKIRNNIETFDNIEEIRVYLRNNSKIYDKLIKK